MLEYIFFNNEEEHPCIFLNSNGRISNFDKFAISDDNGKNVVWGKKNLMFSEDWEDWNLTN